LKSLNKHIVSYLLLLLLFAPGGIKVFDGIFHHHEHFVCTSHHKQHIHEFEENCPILDFELSLQIINKFIVDIPKLDNYSKENTPKQFSIPFGELKYSSQLRAPPSIYK